MAQFDFYLQFVPKVFASEFTNFVSSLHLQMNLYHKPQKLTTAMIDSYRPRKKIFSKFWPEVFVTVL